MPINIELTCETESRWIGRTEVKVGWVDDASSSSTSRSSSRPPPSSAASLLDASCDGCSQTRTREWVLLAGRLECLRLLGRIGVCWGVCWGFLVV